MEVTNKHNGGAGFVGTKVMQAYNEVMKRESGRGVRKHHIVSTEHALRKEGTNRCDRANEHVQHKQQTVQIGGY